MKPFSIKGINQALVKNLRTNMGVYIQVNQKRREMQKLNMKVFAKVHQILAKYE